MVLNLPGAMLGSSRIGGIAFSSYKDCFGRDSQTSSEIFIRFLVLVQYRLPGGFFKYLVLANILFYGLNV